MNFSSGDYQQFTDDVYVLFREFVRNRTGILYGEPRRKIFENRIISRVRVLGMSSARAYFRFLSFHPEREKEFLKLVTVLTNNETFFFREVASLDAIMDLAKKKSAERFRILSAGSSSGEELSTLGILARERGLDASNMEFQGVDIDVSMIDIASNGIYRSKSFRNTDAEHLVKYFVPVGEHRKLRPSISEHLNFRWANLVDKSTLVFPHKFDVILCRNVLIYFDRETVQQVVETLHGILNDDGVLVTGISESLASVPFLFDPVRHDDVIMYRKTPSS